jgi:hypothetical protein
VDAAAAVRSLQTQLLIGFALFGVIAVAVVLFLLLRPRMDAVADAAPPTPAPTSVQPVKTSELLKPNPTVDPPPPPAPSALLEEKFAGGYVNDEKHRPNVLLMRQRDPEPWGRLKPQRGVPCANYLVSLPGYRSELRLESGAYLVLWGNVPEFSPEPVLESVAILKEPDPGFDADVILDRGRILLANAKPMGPVRARLRFLQEVWDVTLPDNKSEAVLELWGYYPMGVPFQKEPGGKGPSYVARFYVKGQADLAVRNQQWHVPDAGIMVWTSDRPVPQGPNKMKALPEWWTDKLETKKDVRRDQVFLALADFADRIGKGKSEDVADDLRTIVREMREPERGVERALAVLCLAALDVLPMVVEALEDQNNTEVRGAAILALRQWISRTADHDPILYRRLQTECHHPRERAEIIMQLLHTFPREAIERGEAQQKLLEYLDHENLAVRVLALWHAQHLLPRVVELGYDPAGEAEQRKQIVEQLRKTPPSGKKGQ